MSTEKANSFDRQLAFSRTIGFVTPDELRSLRGKTVAIAGLGGVGGSHLLTLTRLGVGRFHLAEFDSYGVENFNRQVGANMSTVGKKKLDVMVEMARQINPELEITAFPDGVNAQNVDDFLKGVDVYVDGLDYFVFKTRSLVFKACEQKRIPAVTAGPIGMSTALMSFMPGQMSFHDYFQWKDDDTDVALGVKFLVGLSPSLPHRRYLVDPSSINFKSKKGASTPMGCELCAGVMGCEVLKILLNRGKILAAPYSLQFDGYLNQFFKKRILFGNRNPLQQFKIRMGIRMLSR